MLIALCTGPRVQPDQVVKAVAAGGSGFQEAGVDEGLDEIFGGVSVEVEEGSRSGQ